MSQRIPKTAALVATAATAAFAAYAVGSQTNSGGTAGADPGHTVAAGYGHGPGAGPGREHGRFGDRGAMLDAMAAKLGVTPAKLKAALESLRPTGPRGDHMKGDLAQALADALKLDVAKVTAALKKVAPTRAHGPGRDHHGPRDDTAFPAALAKELGVSTADLTAAFKTLRATHEAQETTERAAFAQKLADKLGVSVDKVKRAFPAGMHGPGHHR